jgi:hypothetical protein
LAKNIKRDGHEDRQVSVVGAALKEVGHSRFALPHQPAVLRRINGLYIAKREAGPSSDAIGESSAFCRTWNIPIQYYGREAIIFQENFPKLEHKSNQFLGMAVNLKETFPACSLARLF